MNLHEALGRKDYALQVSNEEYHKLLALLRAVKEGALAIEDVVITDNGWRIDDKTANNGEK